MMRSVQLVVCALLIATPTVAGNTDQSCLDVLRKMFPDRDSVVLSTVATWLEDNFGATTAEDLKGVSNFAVDGMSLAADDAKLDARTKRVLKRLFSNQVVNAEQARSSVSELRLLFPNTDLNVLQTVAQWLEDNFGASTAEDLDGVSEYAINVMSLAKSDEKLGADAKITVQLFIQTQQARRLMSHSQSSSMTSSTAATGATTTTTTTTTTAAATTTTTAGPTTTTTAGPTTTTTPGPTTTTTNGPTTTTTTGPTTTTTTGPTTTTTTGPTTTTTTAPVTTTTTTPMAAATTTTTTTKTPVVYNGRVTVSVANVTEALQDMPKLKTVMKESIEHANSECPPGVATIAVITEAARRLREQGRRLAAGGLDVDYQITFPSTYTGAGVTKASFDATKMKSKIAEKATELGISITVTSIEVKEPTLVSGNVQTTTAQATTTGAGTEVTGGAVTAQQLASSVAAVLLVKLLSGF